MVLLLLLLLLLLMLVMEEEACLALRKVRTLAEYAVAAIIKNKCDTRGFCCARSPIIILSNLFLLAFILQKKQQEQVRQERVALKF